MADATVENAFLRALTGWRRNAVALGIVLIAFGIATFVGASVAYYAAILITFTTWMAWFVSTGVEFLQIMDE